MSPRPKDVPSISLDDLLPGDIILSRGNTDVLTSGAPLMSFLDWLILELDQGDYTHTTLYTGKKGDDHMVLEAITTGVTHHSIQQDISEQVLLDVYRYNGETSDEWPACVVDKAMTFVGGDYCYSELLLGVLLLLSIDETPSGWDQLLLQIAESEFVERLEHWLDENDKKTPMMCVQVATSAYYEAETSPEHKYALKLERKGNRKPLFPSPMAEAETDFGKIQNRIYALLQKYLPAHVDALMASIQPEVSLTAGSADCPLGTCTPKDMQTSPSLSLVGCLKDER